MDDIHKKKSDQFDEALPLPVDPVPASVQPASEDTGDKGAQQAVELIRQKIKNLYGNEPSVKAEISELAGAAGHTKRSKHQQFIYDLTESGKSLKEIQEAWHEYYAGLPDREKHEVWQEFYNAHAQASHYAKEAAGRPSASAVSSGDIPAAIPTHLPPHHRPSTRNFHKLGKPAKRTFPTYKKADARKHLRSLLFGFSMGALVILIFLFSFFNERFIAPFIQPSRNVTNIPLISDSTAVNPNPEIIIPKINVQIPVIYNVGTIDEAAVEKALEGGVVHYADTALPGQDGNVVIVGHSSNNIFNPGKYKFAFVLLSRMDKGDTFYLQKDGVRYTYQVYKKEIVKPDNVSVMDADATKPAIATLVTCDPPGTSINRLVVVGEQISPDPAGNKSKAPPSKLADSSSIIPGNSPSLWSRLVKFLFD